MTSLRVRIFLAILAVALVGAAVLDTVTRRVSRSGIEELVEVERALDRAEDDREAEALRRELEASLAEGGTLTGAAALLEAALGAVDRGLVAALVTVAVLALATSVLLSRRIVRPVEALAAAAKDLGEGDLGRRVALDGGDEIGRLGRAFNEMASRLERSEALRRRLVNDVAHELRTPLAGLRARIEAIEDGLVPATPEALASLGEDVAHLGGLVDDLQDVALAEAGRLSLDLRPVPVEEAVLDAARSLGLGAAGRPPLELEADAAPPVLADPRRLRQVLLNLLDNARTHGGGAPVTVRAVARPDGMVEFAVRDRGPGIAPEELPLLFERFYRSDPSRSRATGGSGLGLAIVRSLVELHGGSVRAEAAAGGGATVLFTLPRAGTGSE